MLAENEVIIRGPRGQKDTVGGRQRQILHPRFSSEEKVEPWLAEDSSFQEVEGARQRSTGFAVPKVRGENIQKTSIIIDGIELFDPYTGMVPLDEFDTEAFDRFVWAKGSGGAGERLGGSGALNFTSLLNSKNSLIASSRFSTTSGLQLSQRYTSHSGETFTHQTFASYRRHQTPTIYYDDRGTFYNERDDEKIPVQQDHTGASVMEKLRWRSGALSVFAILGSVADEKLNYGAAIRPSTRATSSKQYDFVGIKNSAEINDQLTLQLDLIGTQFRQRLQDPAADLLPFAGSTSYRQSTEALAPAFLFHQDFWSAEIRYKKSWGALRQRGLATETFSKKYSVDRWDSLASVKLFDQWTLSLGGSYEKIGTGQETQEQKSLGPRASWNFLDQHALYASYAEGHRGAPLLFLYGDGASVLAQENLRPERWKQAEAGVLLEFPESFSGSLAFFRTLSEDQITLLQADTSHFRAQNVGRADLKGLEATAEGRWRGFFLGGSYTALAPLQYFDSTEKDQPRTPRETFKTFSGFRSETRQVRLLLTRHGESFLDYQNDVTLGPAEILDFQWDETLDPDHRWEISFAALNLLDRSSQTVESRDGRAGTVSRRDAQGLPLPGRTFQIGLKARFL